VSGLSGRVENGIHCLPIRVYYEDTDSGGIVYYANYLRYAERARTEMLRLSGINQSEMANRYGMAFAVRDCTIDFRYPARLDDLIEVRSRLMDLGAATVKAEQVITRDRVPLVRLGVRIACVREDGRPARIPPAVRAALGTYCQSREQV
jgi:acyl-CoA thioester hydrolase